MLRNALYIIATCSLLAVASCDRSSSGSADEFSSTAALPAGIEGNGLIRGGVKFIGTPPVMKTITATEAVCTSDAPLLEETVIVNGNGTLRNVFVFLEGAPKTNGGVQPAALLDQVHCRYTPHALAVQVAQPVRMRSSDRTMHNVHYNPSLNTARNYAMTQAGQEVTTRFSKPEFVRIKCDVHPWMTAWVGIFENPFYSVTKEDGTFEIKGVPRGTYKLVAWHEMYGRQEQTVTVQNLESGVATEVDFTFGRSQG